MHVNARVQINLEVCDCIAGDFVTILLRNLAMTKTCWDNY